MAPSVPKKKRKVSLPENEEVAARIFEKHRSMAAQQPGGLLEHQARALSAAYSGVCAAKEPVRTPADLARLKGVGGWVVDVMKDSFPGSSLDLSPTSNTPGDTGKKRKRNKPYVPQLNSAAYAIVITLYREMIRGTEFMKKQELIDAAEASGLSRKAIGPNNYKSKHANSSNDFYTGWSCMKNLTDKDLVVKKSNPAKQEKGAIKAMERRRCRSTCTVPVHAVMHNFRADNGCITRLLFSRACTHAFAGTSAALVQLCTQSAYARSPCDQTRLLLSESTHRPDSSCRWTIPSAPPRSASLPVQVSSLVVLHQHMLGHRRERRE